MLGVLAIDREEKALLEGHAIRIRHEKTGRLLTHSASLTRAGRTDALFLSSSSEPHDVDSLFFVHFAPPDDANDEDTTANVLRLATARPPRAWLASPQTEGALVLAHSRSSGAKFLAIPNGPYAVALRIQPVGISAGSSARPQLSASPDREGTVFVSTEPTSAKSRFALNVVPLLETNILHAEAHNNGDGDPTVSSVLSKTRRTPIRLQCCSRGGSFLAALPGERVRLAKADDVGWDVFTLEYDIRTGTALIRDSQGSALQFTDDFSGLTPAENKKPGERFTVEEVSGADGGGDDRVTLRSRKGYVSTRRGQVFLERERKPCRTESFWMRLALPSMADMSKPIRRLKRLANGVRQIEASVEVPVDAKLAYDVVTDYDGLSRFVEDAAESKVVERFEENHLHVRMVQSHTFLVLTLNLGMTLDVRESPEENSVSMEMIKGFGVKEYNGSWKATQKDDNRCLLTCILRAAPALPAPAFLIDGVIMHATCATLTQLRVECVRRAAAKKSGGSRTNHD